MYLYITFQWSSSLAGAHSLPLQFGFLTLFLQLFWALATSIAPLPHLIAVTSCSRQLHFIQSPFGIFAADSLVIWPHRHFSTAAPSVSFFFYCFYYFTFRFLRFSLLFCFCFFYCFSAYCCVYFTLHKSNKFLCLFLRCSRMLFLFGIIEYLTRQPSVGQSPAAWPPGRLTT